MLAAPSDNLAAAAALAARMVARPARAIPADCTAEAARVIARVVLALSASSGAQVAATPAVQRTLERTVSMSTRKPKASLAQPTVGASESAAVQKIGRPSIFTEAIADVICERMADGESLRTICAAEDMPNKATVFRWLADPAHRAFRDQYARARDAMADALFDDTLEIADDARNDWMERRDDKGAGWQANGEHIQRSKLRIDTRKWMAGRLAPKKYGERVLNEHSGPDGAPIEVARSINLKDLNDDDLAALTRIAEGLASQRS